APFPLGRSSPMPSTSPSRPTAAPHDPAAAFPHSEKRYLAGSRDIRVPVREIRLSGGEPSLSVYDTSGPQGYDVRQGLPGVREEWIRARGVEAVRRFGGSVETDQELVPEGGSRSANGSTARDGTNEPPNRRTAEPPNRPT